MSNENTQNKNSFQFLIIVLFVIIGFAIALFACFAVVVKNSPEYALYQTVRAIKSHDSETVMNYINIDAIAQNKIKELKAEFMNSPEIKNNPYAYMAIGMFDAMSQTMIGEIKTGIKAEIENKDNDFKDISEFKTAACLAVKNCGDVTLTKEYVNNTARIGIKDNKKGNDTVYLIMEKNKNTWQVTDITGYRFDGKK